MKKWNVMVFDKSKMLAPAQKIVVEAETRGEAVAKVNLKETEVIATVSEVLDFSALLP